MIIGGCRIIQFYLIIIDDLVRQLTNLLYLRLVGREKGLWGLKYHPNFSDHILIPSNN